VPIYDAESISLTAAAVDRIADDFRGARTRIQTVSGHSPFGEVEEPDDPDRVAGTLRSFTDGMRGEFDAAVNLMTAASAALRDAVRAMTETDRAAADDLIPREL
jgi:hypothetical protein